MSPKANANDAPKRRYLDEILQRKRLEVARRVRRDAGAVAVPTPAPTDTPMRGQRAVQALRRGERDAPRIIAEVKYRSPSAGVIHARAVGDGARIANAYRRGGASAVSVLADGPGFGGSPLEVRRVVQALPDDTPVLFKEFVLDPVQVRLAQRVGASMVLLLVRALPEARLHALVDAAIEAGMAPVVEAADEAELEVALRTRATIVGVNARDLRTFRVDKVAAARALSRVGPERVAVFMSGVRSPADFADLAETRADAVLIGEGLMRAADPEAAVTAMLEGVSS